MKATGTVCFAAVAVIHQADDPSAPKTKTGKKIVPKYAFFSFAPIGSQVDRLKYVYGKKESMMEELKEMQPKLRVLDSIDNVKEL